MTSEKQEPWARAKAVDDPPPLRLVLPSGLVGVNDFATPQWWAGCETQLSAAGIVRTEQEYAAGRRATVLTVPRAAPGVPVAPDGDRVLAVVGPVRDWLGEGSLEDRLARLTQWQEGLLGWAEESPVVVLATKEPPPEPAALVAGAAEVRWPLLDLAARYANRPEVSSGTGVSERYAQAMTAAIGRINRGAWITRDLAVEAAVGSVALACDAPEAADPDAHRLRAATEAALGRLVAAGVRLCGPREVLRWPVPAQGGRLPVQVAAEAALAVLEAIPEQHDTVTLGTAPDLAEVEDLQARLTARKHELASLSRMASSPASLPWRELARRVLGSGRG